MSPDNQTIHIRGGDLKGLLSDILKYVDVKYWDIATCSWYRNRSFLYGMIMQTSMKPDVAINREVLNCSVCLCIRIYLGLSYGSKVSNTTGAEPRPIS
jgi:hypothetical protein